MNIVDESKIMSEEEWNKIKLKEKHPKFIFLSTPLRETSFLYEQFCNKEEAKGK